MSGPFQGSALYDGRVWHRRLKPVDHQLAYCVAMTLLDLDHLPMIAASLRLFSVERFNLMDFRASDHLSCSRGDLKATVDQILGDAGFATGGRIRILCMPRVLGAVFNPLSVYFCDTPDGRLQAILYEVNNTFGESHSYLLAVDPEGGPVHHACRKAFYVSPFNTLDMRYDFSVTPPGPEEDLAPLSVRIDVSDAAGPLMIATFTGARQGLSDAAILRTWLRHPTQALKVVLAIHWEALKLWLKGLRLQDRPSPPTCPVSLGSLPPKIAAKLPKGRLRVLRSSSTGPLDGDLGAKLNNAAGGNAEEVRRVSRIL